jgi:Tetracyclin repressor-like, C-terminal domain
VPDPGPAAVADPAPVVAPETPGQRAFQKLLGSVEACLAAGAGRPHQDPNRLASLVWATEHGLVSARLARPQFHWGSLDGMVTEAVSRLMGFDDEDARRAT